MVDKAHVIVWRSVVIEEWLIEGAKNADEAKRMFHEGAARLVNRSEHDGGNVRAVRLATQADIDGANLNQSAGSGPQTLPPSPRETAP